MNHVATSHFWYCYRRLPKTVRHLADKNFELLRTNPRHPALHLKKIGDFWSVRIGLRHRALAKECAEGLVWFWIGSHHDYDQLIR